MQTTLPSQVALARTIRNHKIAAEEDMARVLLARPTVAAGTDSLQVVMDRLPPVTDNLGLAVAVDLELAELQGMVKAAEQRASARGLGATVPTIKAVPAKDHTASKATIADKAIHSQPHHPFHRHTHW